MTARPRHQLLDELSAWHVRTVIIGPMGNRTAVRLFFTRLLDRPPVWSGGVYVWWHAQTLPLHRGHPAALIKRLGWRGHDAGAIRVPGVCHAEAARRLAPCPAVGRAESLSGRAARRRFASGTCAGC